MPFTKVTFEQVERELRRRNFGILGTVTRDGRSHSTGVLYGVSPPEEPLALYILSRVKSKKVRNITINLSVSFVVPVLRPLLTFIPPSCIQLQGTAEIVKADDGTAIQAFRASYVHRRTLKISAAVDTKVAGEGCFLRIHPDPVIFTYGLGLSLWEFSTRVEHAASRVKIPQERRTVEFKETFSEDSARPSP